MSDYTADFEKAFALTMRFEVGEFFDPTDPETQQGLIQTHEQRRKVGYVNHPNDPGGETKFGIAQNFVPGISVKDITLDQAMHIYYLDYWLIANCNVVPFPLNNMYFDACVNHGTKRGTKLLQEALGMPVSSIDGSFGPHTANVAKNCADVKGASEKYIDAREHFYHAIVDHNPERFTVFLNGWLDRVKRLRDWLSQQ